MTELLRKTFEPEHVICMQGGTDITQLKVTELSEITVSFGMPLTQEEKRALQDQIDTLDDDELEKVTVLRTKCNTVDTSYLMYCKKEHTHNAHVCPTCAMHTIIF